MNGERTETAFLVPEAALATVWHVAIDTRQRSHVGDPVESGHAVILDAASLVVLTDERHAP
jgi:hypothetical protein